MDNRKETAEKIIAALTSRSGFNDLWYNLDEDIQTEITDEIVNILPIHDVSNLLTKYIGTVIESEGCDYIPQKGMQKYDTIKISDEEIEILKERAKIFSDC